MEAESDAGNVPDMTTESRDTLAIKTTNESGRTVVSVGGEVDAASADVLRAAIFDAIESHSGGAVAIDMAEVTFIDSSGLRVLIAGFKACESGGSSLVVVSPSDPVTRLLEITGQLDRFVPAQ